MSLTPHVQTARLALRRFTLADLPFLQRLHADEQVMRYCGGTIDPATSEAILHERILDYYESNPGLGIWATTLRATGACVGMHLLNHMHGESLIQVGYILAAEAWGRGYASEMAAAVLRHGFATLGLPRIVAITDPGNLASQRVLLKSGLQHHGERSFAHPRYASGPFSWFYRDADDWLAEHPQAQANTSPST
ncbi:GNAT family N-acetyltransferase [Nannocystis sp.]|uniref:GNAT family N-acetyltransferase n=1 Tax=Nannocystis sp. TaxID=1962667 RepID=UPI0025DA5465|nr:GNAT family N-acetyltransferase [Nannocystis sp.]MBK7830632.1 GNAT family N-acetyltransferase [Nannocystis sp.]